MVTPLRVKMNLVLHRSDELLSAKQPIIQSLAAWKFPGTWQPETKEQKVLERLQCQLPQKHLELHDNKKLDKWTEALLALFNLSLETKSHTCFNLMGSRKIYITYRHVKCAYQSVTNKVYNKTYKQASLSVNNYHKQLI